MDKRVN